MADVRTIDPNTALVEQNLANPTELEGMEHGGTAALTEADVEAHPEPTALGLDATAWVALAMIAVIAIMLWKKVPAAIGKALDKKIAGIREQLDEAAKLRAEAEALKAEYEAKAAAAGAEPSSSRPGRTAPPSSNAAPAWPRTRSPPPNGAPSRKSAPGPRPPPPRPPPR